MKNINKTKWDQKVTELALEAGGSHYPSVNRTQLEHYTRLVIKDCINAIETVNSPHVRTTFDKGAHESTINDAVNAIKMRFGL